MTAGRTLAVLALVLSVALAGCYYPEAPNHSVAYDGTLATENGTFRMNGTVTTRGGASDDRTYRNVHVALYDEDRQLIDAFSVAPLSTPDDTESHVEGSADVVPTYVVIESPDFWTGERLHVSSYRLSDGEDDPFSVGPYGRYVRKEPTLKAKFDDGWF